MKKTIRISIIVILMFIFFLNGISYGFANDIFIVDLPKGYVKKDENSFVNKEANVFFEIRTIDDVIERPVFTEENLEKLVKNLDSITDEQKEELIDQMVEKHGAEVNIQSYRDILESFKVEDIKEKNIVEITEYKYKAFKIEYKVTFTDKASYFLYYYVPSSKGIYLITFSSNSYENLETEEVKQIVNSLYLKAYINPEDIGVIKENKRNIIYITVIIIISILIITVGIFIMKKNKKR